MCHDEAWKRATARLRTDLGDEVYSSWFGRLELDGLMNGLATISAPTRFLKSWIETHYADRVLAAFAGAQISSLSELGTYHRLKISHPRDAAKIAFVAATMGMPEFPDSAPPAAEALVPLPPLPALATSVSAWAAPPTPPAPSAGLRAD